MVYCINHTRAGSCLLHCWEANFPFPVPPSLFFSGSLSRGWQLSLKGEAGSGNLHNMWVIREQTSSSKCSRKECAAPWKHCLAWEEGIAGINDRQEGQEMRAPGSTCTGPSGRKLSSSVIPLCCLNTPCSLQFTPASVRADTAKAKHRNLSRCTAWLSSNKGNSTLAHISALLCLREGLELSQRKQGCTASRSGKGAAGCEDA